VELALAQHAVEAAGAPPHLLDDARSITDGALHAVRDLSHLLHPALLDDLGLTAALTWYVKGFTKRHGVSVELLHEHMVERLSPEIESAAYRIVQEALTNVARHAQAQSCRVALRQLAGTLFVRIEDDGVGFDPATVSRASGERGLGLISIRERVAQLQGRLHIDASPGHGACLSVELPARVRVAATGEAAIPEIVTPTAPPAVHEVLGG
jgi:signal transduction histidine kinase